MILSQLVSVNVSTCLYSSLLVPWTYQRLSERFSWSGHLFPGSYRCRYSNFHSLYFLTLPNISTSGLPFGLLTIVDRLSLSLRTVSWNNQRARLLMTTFSLDPCLYTVILCFLNISTPGFILVLRPIIARLSTSTCLQDLSACASPTVYTAAVNARSARVLHSATVSVRFAR